MPQSGAGAPEAFISPEMREIGGAVIEELKGVVSSEFLAEQIYSAMADASKSRLSKFGGKSRKD
jgi:hypothetical protein